MAPLRPMAWGSCQTAVFWHGGLTEGVFYFISSQTSLVYSTGSSMGRSAIRQAWE